MQNPKRLTFNYYAINYFWVPTFEGNYYVMLAEPSLNFSRKGNCLITDFMSNKYCWGKILNRLGEN